MFIHNWWVHLRHGMTRKHRHTSDTLRKVVGAYENAPKTRDRPQSYLCCSICLLFVCGTHRQTVLSKLFCELSLVPPLLVPPLRVSAVSHRQAPPRALLPSYKTPVPAASRFPRLGGVPSVAFLGFPAHLATSQLFNLNPRVIYSATWGLEVCHFGAKQGAGDASWLQDGFSRLLPKQPLLALPPCSPQQRSP